MPLDAPAPGALLAGLAEDRHEVALRVADVALLALEQDLVEVHDAEGFVEAVPAQRRREQPIGEPPLSTGQLEIGQPLPLDRREMPVEALLVLEGESGRVALRFVQHGEEVLRLLLHLPRNVLERRAPSRRKTQATAR